MAKTRQNHVFFEFSPHITWLYPIWNALNASTSETLREANSKRDSTLGDFAIAVATKLAILGAVVNRFNADYRNLLKLAAGRREKHSDQSRNGHRLASAGYAHCL